MPKFHFTSDSLPSALPPRMRAKLWTESMDAIGSSFEMGIVTSRKFHGEVSVLQLGRIQIGAAKTVADGSVNVIRSEAKLRQDGDDRIMILINRGETPMSVRQFDRKIELKRDEMTVLAMDMPSECSTPQSGHSHVILLPREVLERPGRMLELFSTTRLKTHQMAQLLLKENVRQLLCAEETLGESLEIASGDYIAHLASTILQMRDPKRAKGQTGSLDARITDIRKQIARSYRLPDLTSGAVGKQLGMSARSVQHILSQHGSTFTEELTTKRLEAAFGLLRSGAAGPIADIAFKCGFSDLSTFYRAFRARYGKTPNAARVAR